MAQADLNSYEDSLKIYRDLKGVIDTAFSDGKEEGKQEGIQEGKLEGLQEGKLEGMIAGKLEVARIMKAKGMSLDNIAELTGLSLEQIATL